MKSTLKFRIISGGQTYELQAVTLSEFKHFDDLVKQVALIVSNVESKSQDEMTLEGFVGYVKSVPELAVVCIDKVVKCGNKQSAPEHNVETACGGAIMKDEIKCIEIIIDHSCNN